MPAIRRRLFIFSCAAPLGAIISYAIVGLFGSTHKKSSGDVDALGWWTGIALLFSGGSFLYVATVIQPLSSPEGVDHSHGDSSSSAGSLNKYQRTALLSVGMILPYCLSVAVGDHH